MKFRISLICLLMTLVAASALAIPQQYRAQQKITSSNGTQQVNTVFVDGGKMRIDAEIGGMKTTTILRPDRGVAYQLMPGNSYVEVPIAGLQKMMTNFQDESVVKREPAGAETVNGKACNKFKLHSGNAVSYLWLEKDSDVPVKMETEDKKTSVEWQGVVIGAQDAALFEVPKSYQKVDLGGMMNDLGALSKQLDGTEQDLKDVKDQIPDLNKQLQDITKSLPQTQSPPAMPSVTPPKEPAPQQEHQ